MQKLGRSLALAGLVLCTLPVGMAEEVSVSEAQVDGISIGGDALDLSTATLLPYQPFEFCYDAESYSYAPARAEEVWAYFELVPIEAPTLGDRPAALRLSDTVGADGRNQPRDVADVVEAFRFLGNRSIASGNVSPRTVIALITEFQNSIGLTPDGKIDPGGYTERRLNERVSRRGLGPQQARDQRSLQTLELVGAMMPRLAFQAPAELDVRKCVTWRAPKWGGEYELRYSPSSLVQPIGSIQTDAQLEDWKDYFLDRPTRYMGTILVDDTPLENLPYAMTLALNGRRPGGREATLGGGATDEPLELSWAPRLADPGNAENIEIEYSVRITPTDRDWGAWTSAQRTEYTFLLKGYHKFELRTRYRVSGARDWIESPQTSRLDFFLEDHFTSPVSSKGVTEVVSSAASGITPDWISENLYTQSRAFLAGVTLYDAAQFEPLPYIENDIDLMAETFGSVGFETVTRVPGQGTRSEILNALQGFLREVKEGDRVVLYFSMHGFEPETESSNPYLASKDCDPAFPGTNCIPLKSLEELVRNAVAPVDENGKGAQHVLVILDACSVGMGLMRQTSKSVDDELGFVERSVIDARGAHVMTAGLADQVAFVDNERRISYFTQALATALSGEADYIPDNVITLRELELFVRHRVALETKAKQTPMVGDIAGAGQIAFVVKP